MCLDFSLEIFENCFSFNKKSLIYVINYSILERYRCLFDMPATYADAPAHTKKGMEV